MNAPSRTILIAGLKPSTIGPLRKALESVGRVEVTTQLRKAIERVWTQRPALVVLPADRGAGLAACDRLRSDDSPWQPIVWLLSEDGLTARVAAHWLRPSRAHLYGVLPLSTEFIDRHVVPLLPEPRDHPSSPLSVAPEYTDDDLSGGGSLQPNGEASTGEYGRLRERLANTRHQLRAVERANSEINAKLAETREALATAHSDLARRHEELRQANDAGSRDKHRVDELEDDLDATRRELDVERRRLNAEVTRLRESLDETRRALQETQARAARLERDTTSRDALQRKRIEELESSRTELERRVETLRQREGELRQSLQVTRAATDADMRRRDQDVQRMHESLSAAARVERDSAEQIKLLQADNTTLRAAMVTAEARLARDKGESAKQMALLRTDLAEAHSRLDDTTGTEQLRMAEEQIEALKAALTQATESATEARRELKAERSAGGDTLVDLEKSRSILEARVQRLTEERDEVRARLQSSAAGSADERARLLALGDSTDRLRRERDALDDRQSALHSDIRRLEVERDTIQKAYTEMTRERDGFRADRDDLVGVRARVRARLDVAEQEREEFRALYQSARTEKSQHAEGAEELRRERDALREERNRLAEQHLPVVEERNRLRNELGPLRAEKEQANHALAATRARLSQLRTELDAERERVLEFELSGAGSSLHDGEETTAAPDSAWRRAHRESKEANARLRQEVSELAGRVGSMTRGLDKTRAERREVERRLSAAELEAEEARTQQVQDLDWFMDTLRAIRGPRD